MRLLRILFLGLLLVGLYFLYQYLEMQGFFKKETVAREEMSEKAEPWPKYLLAPREELESFTITQKNLRAKFRKESGQWLLVSPVKGKARDEFLKVFFKSLHELTFVDAFAVKKSELERYGLEPGFFELEFTSSENSKSRTLVIGDNSPDGVMTYARWLGAEKIYMVKGPIKPLLKMSLSEIRSPELFPARPSPVTALVRNIDGAEMKAVFERGSWRMKVPQDEAIDSRNMAEYLEGFWRLQTLNFSDAAQFPAISGKEGVKFQFENGKSWVLWIGKLDSLRSAYPVEFPEQKLSTWLSREALEPLLKISPDVLYSRNFLNIPLEKVDRLTVMALDQRLFFVAANHLWYLVKERQARVPFEPLDTLLPLINDLKYLQKLGSNEKSALLFDPSEVKLEIQFFKISEKKPFIEFKCYVRDDYEYVELNNSPPLYVLPKGSVLPLIQVLSGVGKE